jgi:hypothetical protein
MQGSRSFNKKLNKISVKNREVALVYSFGKHGNRLNGLNNLYVYLLVLRTTEEAEDEL